MSEANDSVHLMTLGGGLEIEDGTTYLSGPSQQRVTRTAAYYHAHKDQFASRDTHPWILCSGGYPGSSSGLPAPPPKEREAILMRDALVRAEVPHSLIMTEADSSSTTSNFTNCREYNLLRPGDFSVENPLGIVTHPHHMRRALRLAALSGIPAVQPIYTDEKDNAVREFVLRTLLTLGARSLESAQRREDFIARLLAREALARF